MKLNVSVIIPLYNGEKTIANTLDSLFRQEADFNEVIVINNGSSDSSLNIVHRWLQNKRHYKSRIKIIDHKNPIGLSRAYNEGIKLSNGDLVITLHQDVVLLENCIKTITNPFCQSDAENVVATTHIVVYPYGVWNNYNFWGKVYFARFVGKEFFGLDGKFDCFRKEVLLRIGGFDEEHFHSAGEDGDIVFRLKSAGKILQTDAKIIHIHNVTNDFGPKDIIFKQKQYSEAWGVLLRLGRIKGLSNLARTFFREILLFLLLIPYVNMIATVLIIFYSFFYTRVLFTKKYKDSRLLLVPILNVYLLFVSLFYSCRGFINGKQKL